MESSKFKTYNSELKLDYLKNIKIISEYLKDFRNEEERTKLINKYIEFMNDELINEIYYIIVYKDILINRTCLEQLKYIDKIVESKVYGRTSVIYLITNKNILENKTFEEHINLIDKYNFAQTDSEAYYSYLRAVNKVKVK